MLVTIPINDIVLVVTGFAVFLSVCLFMGGGLAITQKDYMNGLICLFVSFLVFVPCGRVFGWY